MFIRGLTGIGCFGRMLSPNTGADGGGGGADEDRGDNFTPEEEEGGIVLDADLDPELLALVVGNDGEEEGGETEPDPVKEEKEEKGGIPKARFDEVNNRAKAAEEELARLRAQLAGGKPVEGEGEPAATAGPIDTLQAELKETRTKARDALMDGDMDEHDRLQDEADKLNRRIAREELRAESAQEKVTETLNSVAAEAFTLYPFLDTSKADCDMDAVVAVRSRRFELEQQGTSPAEALRQAVNEKGPRFAKLNGITVDTSKADEIRKEREAKARAKAAGASMAQPSMVPGSERESFRVDPAKLSDAEYQKLPESVKAKLRGDYV